MNGTDKKAGEPSMEEILASIRQIISDDPSGSVPESVKRPAATNEPRQADAQTGFGSRSPGGPAPQSLSSQPASPIAGGLDQQRGNGAGSAPAGGLVGSQAPLVAPAGSKPQQSEVVHTGQPEVTTPSRERSGLFGRLADALRDPGEKEAASPVPAQVEPGKPGLLDQPLAGRGGPAAAPSQRGPVQAESENKGPVARDGQEPGAPASADGKNGRGLGRIPGQRGETGNVAVDPNVGQELERKPAESNPVTSATPGPAAASAKPAGSHVSLADRLRARSAANADAAATKNATGPALAEALGPKDPVVDVVAEPVADETATPLAESEQPKPPRPVLAEASTSSEDERAGRTFSAAATADDDAEPAATATASAPEPSQAKADVEAEIAAQRAVAEADSSGAVSADQAVAGLAQVTTTAQGVKTLEDTVSELLRPLLREWLENNMPRIVEKALRVEVAESVKALGGAEAENGLANKAKG